MKKVVLALVLVAGTVFAGGKETVTYDVTELGTYNNVVLLPMDAKGLEVVSMVKKNVVIEKTVVTDLDCQENGGTDNNFWDCRQETEKTEAAWQLSLRFDSYDAGYYSEGDQRVEFVVNFPLSTFKEEQVPKVNFWGKGTKANSLAAKALTTLEEVIRDEQAWDDVTPYCPTVNEDCRWWDQEKQYELVTKTRRYLFVSPK